MISENIPHTYQQDERRFFVFRQHFRYEDSSEVGCNLFIFDAQGFCWFHMYNPAAAYTERILLSQFEHAPVWQLVPFQGKGAASQHGDLPAMSYFPLFRAEGEDVLPKAIDSFYVAEFPLNSVSDEIALTFPNGVAFHAKETLSLRSSEEVSDE